RTARGVVERPGELGAPRLAAVDVCHVDRHALWSHALDVRLEKLFDLLRVLVRDEAAAHLGHRLGWQNGLGTLAGVAAQKTVHLARGAHPDALQRGESFFSAQCGRASFGAKMLIAERQLAD